MTPRTDPRPFPEVLRDWLARHQLSNYEAARIIGASHGSVVGKWLGGGSLRYEPSIRAMMAAVDADRATLKK